MLLRSSVSYTGINAARVYLVIRSSIGMMRHASCVSRVRNLLGSSYTTCGQGD